MLASIIYNHGKFCDDFKSTLKLGAYGILNSEWYFRLFELAVDLYDKNVYAYYFDLPFEETLKRHRTKPNCNEFGKEEMRRWWKEKDYVSILNEVNITADEEKESIVRKIYRTVVSI